MERTMTKKRNLSRGWASNNCVEREKRMSMASGTRTKFEKNESLREGYARRFDYERAWAELALPGFESLTLDVLGILAVVRTEAKTLSQGSSLDMPWPEDDRVRPALKPLFVGVEDVELAKAARIVYSFGHWAPGREISLQNLKTRAFDRTLREKLDAAMAMQKDGVYWKFSNYVDQVLSERLGLKRERRLVPKGVTFSVMEGALRASWSHEVGFQHVDIGWASQAMWKSVQNERQPNLSYNSIHPEQVNKAYQAWDDYTEALIDAHADDYEYWDFRKFMTTSP